MPTIMVSPKVSFEYGKGVVKPGCKTVEAFGTSEYFEHGASAPVMYWQSRANTWNRSHR
ncbi:unnamed protein product [Periconia digitata]|uniref:Uncharacterized protein n=1 Tax=Periconia digitata TaxID=1303443 RepID=A0A9W4UI17_9PLEO|nr:unnamed protein product [Periconia digitata]